MDVLVRLRRSHELVSLCFPALIPITAVFSDNTSNIYSTVFAERRSSDTSLRHEGSWRTLWEAR